MNAIPSHVYVIATAKGIKVGRSKSVEDRLRAMRTYGVHGELLCMTPLRANASLVEREVHKMLQPHLMGGEWFDVSSEVAIDALVRACDVCGDTISQPFSMRISPELKDQLQRLADLDCRSLASYVEKALAEHVINADLPASST